MYFYSAQTAGFYTPEIHGDVMPADVVEVSAELHAELMAGQGAGKRIAADNQGRPVLVDPPPPSAEELNALSIEAINRARDEGLAAGVVLWGKRFHSDDRFLMEIMGMIMGYQAGLYSGTQSIRTRDKTVEQLNAGQLTELAAAVGAHRKAVYAASWAEKDVL